jgi:hypothetical protein
MWVLSFTLRSPYPRRLSEPQGLSGRCEALCILTVQSRQWRYGQYGSDGGMTFQGDLTVTRHSVTKSALPRKNRLLCQGNTVEGNCTWLSIAFYRIPAIDMLFECKSVTSTLRQESHHLEHFRFLLQEMIIWTSKQMTNCRIWCLRCDAAAADDDDDVKDSF